MTLGEARLYKDLLGEVGWNDVQIHTIQALNPIPSWYGSFNASGDTNVELTSGLKLIGDGNLNE
jgi:hypothetical protein